MTDDFDLSPLRRSTEAIQRLLVEHWGVQGQLTTLPGERDLNVCLSADDGRRWVAKTARAHTGLAEFLQEIAILQHLDGRTGDIAVPRVVPTIAGQSHVVDDADGESTVTRVVEFIPGKPLAEVRHRAPALLIAFGRAVGTVATAMRDAPITADRTDFPWHPLRAMGVLEAHAAAVSSPDGQRGIARARRLWAHVVEPRLGDLRHGGLYNDANDHNVLVHPDGAGPETVTGILDFGDVVHGPLVSDLAVAIAYGVMAQHEPLVAATYIVRGFHAACPLEEGDLNVLFPLVLARLAVSISLSAARTADGHDDPYLTVSEAPALDLLRRFDRVHERIALGMFRHACGFPPSAAGAAVTAWLAAHGADAAPVVDPDPRTVTTAPIDLSIGSDLVDDPIALTGTPALSERVVDIMAAAGATIGVGRYDEARCLYTSEVFARAADDRHERRTIHIGVDLFLPPGAPVHAPFDGVVHSIRDNAGHLDYGPTIVLEHRPPDGPVFYTLYGHLSRSVLGTLAPGTLVSRGTRIATLGAFDENGHWPPHLHVQVVADLLDTTGDFPGVAPPSERDVWCGISPDPTPFLHLPDTTRAPRADAAALRRRRRDTVAPSLSLHYRAPLHIVRGRGATLYDAEGRAYLDLQNNVAHVGHAHPAVAAAIARQSAVLNTNTRYLHETILAYADRLTALLPNPLRVCVFVNSGSEANDLALRMAHAATGRTGLVVIDGAYHGHTASLIDASPYKFDAPGGAGCPAHVRVVPTPDRYRGRHRDGDATGAAYADYVRDACADLAAAGTPPAAFLAESLLSCAGQIDPPPGYLADAFAHARAAGALAIADEVQIGFGRVGTGWWGFETQGVVPDIVTMGKPIGNGHPLGAVVTTHAIAEAFANGMEYFNTFGGNPVSCAAGLAVLDVIASASLIDHADAVGSDALARLRGLAARDPRVGDVRGRGLFLGIELVRDPAARDPATAEAAWVVERLRERGILASTDGPDANVLKIKPPMVIAADEMSHFVDHLEAVLALLP